MAREGCTRTAKQRPPTHPWCRLRLCPHGTGHTRRACSAWARCQLRNASVRSTRRRPFSRPISPPAHTRACGRDTPAGDMHRSAGSASGCGPGLAPSPRSPSLEARACAGRTRTRSDREVLSGHVRTGVRGRGCARSRRARAHLERLKPVLLHVLGHQVRAAHCARHKPATGRTRAQARSVGEVLSTHAVAGCTR